MRYVGEAVVAIVAENRYIAEDALALVDIDYAPLTVLVDPEASLAEGAPTLHDDLGSNILAEREFARGEVDVGLLRPPQQLAAGSISLGRRP